jgi:predicted ferric reductase
MHGPHIDPGQSHAGAARPVCCTGSDAQQPPRGRLHIKPIASASVWIALYLLLIVAPLLVLLVGETPRGGGFWWDFALALGYSALAMMGVQFWLTARFKRASAPFGIDVIYVFHRYLATIACAFLLLHVVILLWFHPAAIGRIDPRYAPGYMTLGWLAALAFLTLIVSSLWRKRLRIEYDHWRHWHGALAVLGILFGMLHALGSGSFLNSPLKRWLWGALALSWLGLFLWVRLLRPLLLLRHPYRVVEVRREPGRNWSLLLQPERPPRLTHQPGQFAWLSLRASPLAQREHPFSIASSPTQDGPLRFAIKELGDFTSTIGSIGVGEIAYVDGPYGNFSIDSHPEAAGYVFVAGGVGIAPVMSMLEALADRGDRRPLLLFYGNRCWDRVVFREALDALRQRLDLRVVHVLGEPPEGWTGERGVIDLEVMRRHLPADATGLHFFVCGPNPMIRLVERNLAALGLPLRQLHSEIFDLA